MFANEYNYVELEAAKYNLQSGSQVNDPENQNSWWEIFHKDAYKN